MADKDSSRSRIDEEMRNLRSQRNALTSICRLPREGIEDIFLRTRDLHWSDPHTPIKHIPSWVNVSYVCRHWRTVALDCPALWSHHFVLSLCWTEELLARSRRAPLKIHLKFSEKSRHSWYSSHLKQLMKHSERFEEFHLHITYTCNRILSQLSSPAPRIKSLEVSVKTHSSDWPPALFLGNAPTLSHLELSDCPVPWHLFNQSTLTSLSLYDVPEKIQQTIQEFLPLLGSLQNLTYLYLDHAVRSAAHFLSNASFQTFQKINLPRLSRLWIIAPLSTVIAMLSHVEIPLNTELRLEYFPEADSSPNDGALLYSLLAQRSSLVSENPALSKMIIRSLLIDFNGAGKLAARLIFSAMKHNLESPFSVPHAEWDCNIPLKVVIRGNSEVEVHNAVGQMCCSMPLGKVQSAHFIAPPFSQALWTEMFGHLKRLRHIKLSEGKMPDIASVLSFSALGHASAGYILLPHLQVLVLDRMILGEGGFVGADADAHTITEPSLIHALSTRNTSKGRLILYQCRRGYYHGGRDLINKVRSWDGTILVDDSEISTKIASLA